MLDFNKMVKKSDFQYERDTIKIFCHFLASKDLCIARAEEVDGIVELFILSDEELGVLYQEFIHECVKR